MRKLVGFVLVGDIFFLATYYLVKRMFLGPHPVTVFEIAFLLGLLVKTFYSAGCFITIWVEEKMQCH